MDRLGPFTQLSLHHEPSVSFASGKSSVKVSNMPKRRKLPSKAAPPIPVVRERRHPWRKCPYGQHWVRTHPLSVPPSEKHPEGYSTMRENHCANNPSGKDQLYCGEIHEIASERFTGLNGAPAANALGYDNGNTFDHLIRGWVRYWNEVLAPAEPLDPDVVKALIATESGFDPAAWNHEKGKRAAYGLMQVTNATVQLLKDPRELRDHFVNLDQNDMKDPNLSICAGVRWLFRKKDLAQVRLKRSATWREAVREYKGYKPTDKDQSGMEKFDERLAQLKTKIP